MLDGATCWLSHRSNEALPPPYVRKPYATSCWQTKAHPGSRSHGVFPPGQTRHVSLTSKRSGRSQRARRAPGDLRSAWMRAPPRSSPISVSPGAKVQEVPVHEKEENNGRRQPLLQRTSMLFQRCDTIRRGRVWPEPGRTTDTQACCARHRPDKARVSASREHLQAWHSQFAHNRAPLAIMYPSQSGWGGRKEPEKEGSSKRLLRKHKEPSAP